MTRLPVLFYLGSPQETEITYAKVSRPHQGSCKRPDRLGARG